jgi:DNA-directed RNA polymerase subunit alpha
MRIRWRGLELPSQVTCDRSSLTSTYGKFTAEPFERGFGVTVGNSLRRILLSSLEGSAVTQVKVHGVQHEFMTLPGVVEDLTDIVLNVKSLVVKNTSEQTRVIRIDKNTRGGVTGADVLTDGMVEVINPQHVIATLTDDVPFTVEMVVENGRGYVPAGEHGATQEIGVIPLDAAFSPIVRVRYEVEETRVGQKTNYDKLTLEIWTNGSIGPELALVEAAKILRKHLNPFVQYRELGPMIFAEARSPVGAGLDPATEAKLSMSLAELDLSVRATNCLESENINTVRDLVSHSEDQLLDVRNFGETTLAEVREKLHQLGLHMGMRVPPAPASPL